MKEKYFWVDLLRAAAMAAVVLVHVAADVVTEWRSVPASVWWTANFYDTLARGAVPLFVMLSGALLLPQSEGFLDFFRGRFRRIFIPFVAWTVFYLVWRKCFYEPSLGLPEALKRAAGGGVHFHLWFLYMITGLYLLTPVLRVFTAHASRQVLFYFLGFCFIAASLAPFWDGLDDLVFHTGLRFRIPLESVQGFTGYFVLGFALSKESKPSFLPWAGFLWLGSFFVCLAGSGWAALGANSFPILFYDNLAPNVVLYAASVFVIVKESVPRFEARLPEGVKRFVLSLSACSFGIYLVHPVFIDIFDHGRWGFKLTASPGHPVGSIPMTAFAVYLASYLAVLVLKKVPGLRATV